MSGKTLQIVYWISTVLFAGFMAFSSSGGLEPNAQTVQFLHDYLGFPIYFIRFISIAKIAGAITLLIPGLKSIKEWAYAGLFFDLAGAIVAIISVSGKFEGGALFILMPILIGLVSYFTWKKRLAAGGR